VRALDPELVWLAHTHEPWRPRTSPSTLRRRPGSS
jgi:N-acyl homoserine lactone hydrolase